MSIETWLLYTLVSAIAILSPGPAVLLAITNGMTGNPNRVVASSLGNIFGLFVLSSISMLGLGAILLASSTLFLMVKITGAMYLIYLGVSQFRKTGLILRQSATETQQKTFIKALTEGFLVAVTNPKPIVFFIALFPSFLNTSSAILPQFLTMTLTFMALSFITLQIYGKISRSAKSLLYDKSRMGWFNKVTGAIFIAMAAGLLTFESKTD